MSAIEDRIVALPIWRGRPVLAPLAGGISNQSFTATDETGRYVVRVMRDFPFHHVYREREIEVGRAGHIHGFSPALLHAEPTLMVSEYIDGRVYTAADIAPQISRIADLLRRFHSEMAADIGGAGFIFWVFHVNRDYVRQLRARGEDARFERWLTLNAQLEAVQMPLPICFGHHDLLPANLIDDGKKLWLIDFEYAGFGTAMFDLANLSSNAGLDAGQSEALLRAYFGTAPTTDMLRSHAAMEAASLLREALWSLVSIGHLDRPGVDYAAYADDNFARLDAALTAYRRRFGDLP